MLDIRQVLGGPTLPLDKKPSMLALPSLDPAAWAV